MSDRLSTGITGLDEILLGGLLPGRVYMIRGLPGAGKTTLGLQFLLEGAARGESTLFITLSEPAEEIAANARLHGWDLAHIGIIDLSFDGIGLALGADSQYSIFHPAEVELGPVVRQVEEAIARHNPSRVVFDSMTELRILSRDPLRYRRQVMGLCRMLNGRGITSLFLGESSRQELDLEIASIVQGVISIRLSRGQKGMTRRGIEVEKYRGSAYREGEHALRIEGGGLRVFPRLLALEHGQSFERSGLPSGIEELDALLMGGLDRGTSTLITGHAGVGKTTLGLQFLARAAAEGDGAILFTFDEGAAELEYRAESIGMGLRELIDRGTLRVKKVNPLLLYPDEFAAWVREEVEVRGVKVIMIDTLNGYDEAMPDEKYLTAHMRQLVAYLGRMGVTTILVNEVSNLTGDFSASEYGLSYLADAVLMLKYYEYAGRIKKAIGVLKKRLSDHERVLRSFDIGPKGIEVGPPLPGLRGVMSGEAVATTAPDADSPADRPGHA